MQNQNLFTIDGEKLLFYIDEEVDRVNYRRLDTLIEKNGGINQDLCTSKTINLISIKNHSNFVNKRSNYKLYDSQFINDSIEKNCLQPLEDYRIPESIIEEDCYEKKLLLSYPSLKNTYFSCSQWSEPICLSEDVILESCNLEDDDDDEDENKGEDEDKDNNNVEKLTTNPVDPEPVLCEQNIDETRLKNTDGSADNCVDKPVYSTSPKQLSPNDTDVALPESLSTRTSDVSDYFSCKNFDSNLSLDDSKESPPDSPIISADKKIDSPPRNILLRNPFFRKKPETIRNCQENDLPIKQEIDLSTHEEKQLAINKVHENTVDNVLDDSPEEASTLRKQSSPNKNIKNNNIDEDFDKINLLITIDDDDDDTDFEVRRNSSSVDDENRKRNGVISKNIETKNSILKPKSSKNTENDLKIHSSNVSDKNTVYVMEKSSKKINNTTKNNREIFNEVTSTTNLVSSVAINKSFSLSNDKSTQQENPTSKDSDDSFVCNSQDEEETTSKRLKNIKKLKRLKKLSPQKSTGTLNIEKITSKALDVMSANDTIDKSKILMKKKLVKIPNAFDDNFEINTSKTLQRNDTQFIKDKATNNSQDNDDDDDTDGVADDKAKKLANNEKSVANINARIVKSTSTKSKSLAVLLSSESDESVHENSDKETSQLTRQNIKNKRRQYHHETWDSFKTSTPTKPTVKKIYNRVCEVVPTPSSSSSAELNDEYINISKRNCHRVDNKHPLKAKQLENNSTQTKAPRRFLNEEDEEEFLDELTNSFYPIKRKSKKNIYKENNSMPIKSSKELYFDNLRDESDDENETSKLRADKKTTEIILISDSDDENYKQQKSHSKNDNTLSKKLKIIENNRGKHLQLLNNINSIKKSIERHRKISNKAGTFVADSDGHLIIDRNNDPYRRYPTESGVLYDENQPYAWLEKDNRLFFRTDFDTRNHTIQSKGSFYREWEDNEMIRYIYENNYFHQAKSIRVWNRLISTGLFTHRGSYSLLDRWNRMFRDTRDKIINSELPKKIIKILLEHYEEEKKN